MAQADKPLLIVLAGGTFAELRTRHGDFSDWIAAGLASGQPCCCVDAREQGCLPSPSNVAGVVVSGSHEMVTDQAPWSEQLAVWLRRCVALSVPVLAICFGHQLLAHALGGRVGYRAQGMEIGTLQVSVAAAASADALFSRLPPAFSAQLVHHQSVLALPPGALVLASSAAEPHQAFRIGACAWGVQFHPEFDANVMRGYIAQLAAQGHCPAQLATAVGETPDAASLLRCFADICSGAQRQAM